MARLDIINLHRRYGLSMPPDDAKPDWRDPDMPVLAAAAGCYVDHRFLSLRAQAAMAPGAQGEYPDWKSDPTYNMRRARRR